MLRFISGPGRRRLLGGAADLVLQQRLDLLTSPPSATAEEEFHKHPKHLTLASDGPFGKFDRKQLQRGFQVYKEVCAACHGLSLVAFRDLEALGYNEAEVKAIAEQWAIEVPSINPETGEAATRKALPVRPLPDPMRTRSRRARRTTMRFRPTCR